MSVEVGSKPNYGRRVMWLAFVVVILCGGYTLGWFYLADKLEAKAKTSLAELNRDGVVAECTNPVARGFPFRLGLFCDRVAFDDAKQGFSVSAGSFRSVGQVYDPAHLIAELDGPARIDTPRTEPFALDWDNLRASVRLARPLPERVSVEGHQLKASTVSGKSLATVDTFEGHMRPDGANIDLAGTFSNLLLDSSLVQGRTLPLLSGDTDFTINNGVELVGNRIQSLRGQSGTIRNLDLSTSEKTGISVTGPFSVDQDGLLDADLRVTVRDPQGLATVLGGVLPEKSREIQQGFMGLSILGPSPSLPLKIVKGKISLAFIKLGQVPPLQ
ncbi:DUF2125 domain-containing protein [Pseudaminobacter soli (ex Li et al. 2025)]|uniref:DUF2125 domain-containing protein n=1 Tax=Pseudaminobacter soli (ex Li et al. 2025) TaxID=1295366 RepID=A0A2P7SAA5_9HYPH|nr:DUF2125 domain-containing protein [Mesorhizobium soli]PSJ59429.1 hypothetical protein C7I85_17685 [Mesorhizobium soli]